MKLVLGVCEEWLCACASKRNRRKVVDRVACTRPSMFSHVKIAYAEFLSRSRRKVLSRRDDAVDFPSGHGLRARIDGSISYRFDVTPAHATFSCSSNASRQPLNSRLNLHGDATWRARGRRRPTKKPVTSPRASR